MKVDSCDVAMARLLGPRLRKYPERLEEEMFYVLTEPGPAQRVIGVGVHDLLRLGLSCMAQSHACARLRGQMDCFVCSEREWEVFRQAWKALGS